MVDKVNNEPKRYTPQANIPLDDTGRWKYVSDELNKISLQFGEYYDISRSLALCNSIITKQMVDGDVLAYAPTENSWCTGRRTRFIPEGFTQGLSYQKGDEVANGAQVSEALIDGATEYPYISPTGNEIQGYAGTLTNQQTNLRQLIFGQRYYFSINAYIKSIRLYLFAGQTYVIEKAIIRPLQAPEVSVIANVSPAVTGWYELSTGTILAYPGLKIDILARFGDLSGNPNQTDWTRELNYYNPQPFPNVEIHGLLAIDNPYNTIVADENAYGVDITVQPAYIPTEWFVKVSSDGGAGGGAPGGGEVNTTSNEGTGEGLAMPKDGTNFPFKTIKPGTGISLSSTTNELTITSTAEANTTSNQGGGQALAMPKVGTDFPFKTLVAGANIDLTSDVTTVTIAAQTGRPTVIFTALTTYNVTAGDENALICTTSNSPVSFVLPDGTLPTGFITHVHQYGTGQVTVSAVAPSVCVSSRSLLTRAQHSALSVFNLGNGSYSVVGDQE